MKGRVVSGAHAIRDGQAAGAFREVDAETAADLLMGMERSTIHFGDSRLMPARAAENILTVFLEGIAICKMR